MKMKLEAILISVLWSAAILPQTSVAQLKKDDPEELLREAMSDLQAPDTIQQTEEGLADPKNAPYFLGVLRDKYFHGTTYEEKSLGLAALSALQRQKTLSEEQLGVIRDELVRLVSKDLTKEPYLESFACSAVRVFQHYPSPANEELVLSFLNKDKNPIRLAAVRTLGAIGTARSLPALKKVLDEFQRYTGAERAFFLPEAQTAVLSIQGREAAKNLKALEQNAKDSSSPGPDQAGKSADVPAAAAAAEVKSGEGISSSGGTWVYVLLCLLVFPAAWLLLRRK